MIWMLRSRSRTKRVKRRSFRRMAPKLKAVGGDANINLVRLAPKGTGKVSVRWRP